MEHIMTTARYINRVILGVMIFIPFFVFFCPFFQYLDWLCEDNEDEYVTPNIKQAFWDLFKRNIND